MAGPSLGIEGILDPLPTSQSKAVNERQAVRLTSKFGRYFEAPNAGRQPLAEQWQSHL
jgi:hypothetical protein